MEQKFAKVFDLPNGVQVLVLRDTQKEAQLIMRTEMQGVVLEAAVTYRTWSAAQKSFDEYTEDKAVQFRTGAVDAFIESENKLE